MIEPPSVINGSAFWTVNNVPFTLAAHRSNTSLDGRSSGVQLGLTPAGDVDDRAFGCEAPRACKADAAAATGDECDFAFENAHMLIPSNCLRQSADATELAGRISAAASLRARDRPTP
jgi:hypothetical protein